SGRPGLGRGSDSAALDHAAEAEDAVVSGVSIPDAAASQEPAETAAAASLASRSAHLPHRGYLPGAGPAQALRCRVWLAERSARRGGVRDRYQPEHGLQDFGRHHEAGRGPETSARVAR